MKIYFYRHDGGTTSWFTDKRHAFSCAQAVQAEVGAEEVTALLSSMEDALERISDQVAERDVRIEDLEYILSGRYNRIADLERMVREMGGKTE